MSVDWDKAPEWADRAIRRSDRFEWIFGNDEKFQAVGGKIVNYGEGDYYSLDEFKFMEMRPDRINAIKIKSDMDNIDWDKAPDWADSVRKTVVGDLFWCNDKQYLIFGYSKESNPVSIGSKNQTGILRHYTIDNLELVEMRTDAWKEGEERMNVIPQNGNDGEHYEELDNLEKQPRYTDEDDQDWIDEFAANNSIDDFRAAMRFTIGKYERRLGKKDELSKELYKMSDYYQRWSKVEKELEK